jgi:hypothetical protein
MGARLVKEIGSCWCCSCMLAFQCLLLLCGWLYCQLLILASQPTANRQVRAKAVKCIGQAAEVDPRVLGMAEVQRGVATALQVGAVGRGGRCTASLTAAHISAGRSAESGNRQRFLIHPTPRNPPTAIHPQPPTANRQRF